MFLLNEKFWSKVNKTENCWNWIGGKSSMGYSRFRVGKKFFSPHRMVMNCVEKNIDVCHHCDNPSCVNPKHLFLGTRKDNMIDASIKGRLYSGVHPSLWNYDKGCRCEDCKLLKKIKNRKRTDRKNSLVV